MPSIIYESFKNYFRSPQSNEDEHNNNIQQDDNTNSIGNDDPSVEEAEDDGGAITQPQPFPLLDNLMSDEVVVDTETAESLRRLLQQQSDEPNVSTASSSSPPQQKMPARSRNSEDNNPLQQPAVQQPLTTAMLDELQADIVDWLSYIVLRQKEPSILKSNVWVLENFFKQTSFDLAALESEATSTTTNAATNAATVPTTVTTTSNSSNQPPRTPKMQSLWKRLMLTTFHSSLCAGIVGISSATDNEEEMEDDPTSNERDELNVREWESLHRQFVDLAKEFRVPTVPAPTQPHNAAASNNNTVGGEGRDDPAVQKILQLLGIQHALASLMADMNLILQERPRNVRLETREAMECYHQHVERSLGQIPSELFACSPEDAPSTSRGIDRVILKIRQIASDGPYSIGVVQTKVQAKLLAWEEEFCGIPVLVQLGYRGVIPPPQGSRSLANAAGTAALTARSVAAATAANTNTNEDNDIIMAGDLSSFGAASGSESSNDDDVDGEPLGTDQRRKRQRMSSTSGASKFSAVSSSTSNNNNGNQTNNRKVPDDKINPAVIANQIRQVRRSVKQPRRQPQAKQPQPQQAVVAMTKQDDSDYDSEDPEIVFQTQPPPPPPPPPARPMALHDQNFDSSDDDSEILLPYSKNKKKDLNPVESILMESSESSDEDDDDDAEADNTMPSQRNQASSKRQRHKKDVLPPARRRPKPATQIQIAIDDSSTEDDDDGGTRRVAKRRRLTHSSRNGGATKEKSAGRQLEFSGDEGDDNNDRENPKQNTSATGRTRVFFTEDEVEAIREGVSKYGAGRWQEIKINSNGRLAKRTPGQIKDKYRNMNRADQI